MSGKIHNNNWEDFITFHEPQPKPKKGQTQEENETEFEEQLEFKGFDWDTTSEITFQKVLMFNGYLPTTHQGLMTTINESSLTTPALIFLGANDMFYELGLDVKSVYSNFQEVISTSASHHLPYSNDSMFQTVKQFLY